MAGDEGFEPPILGPEPSALPLGQSPIVMTGFYFLIGPFFSLINLYIKKAEYNFTVGATRGKYIEFYILLLMKFKN